MKKFAIATAIASLFASAAATATPFVWGNVYTDVLVNENASVKESQIIGIEGGVVTDTTKVYGFFEHNPDLENQFGKVTIHRKVIEDFGVYAHGTAFKEGVFAEGRYVLGAGYTGLSGEGWEINPYLGFTRIETSFDEDTFSINNSTDNVAFGYAGYYTVQPGTTLSSWADARVDSDDDNKVKVQSSIGIQHDLIGQVYIGAFYNMNYGEQGQKHFSDSVQLRVGYHF